MLGMLALGLALLVSGSQWAEAGPRGREVEGTLSAIDLTNSTVTIANRAGVQTVVAVTAATKIERNDRRTTIDTLVVGEKAEAKLDASGNAQKLEVKSTVSPPPGGGGARPTEVEGTLSAVDLIAKTATITTRNGTVVVVAVLDTTMIERNDRHATLAQFVVGDRAEAKLDAAGNALKVEAKTPR